MASPFGIFRKYQKVLIAVFGIGLMIAFLVEGSLLNMLTGAGGGGPRPGQTNVPVTFKGGSLTDEQLARMHRADQLADMLIDRVRNKVSTDTKAQIKPFPDLDYEPRTEARLVRNYLLAKKAHELGLSLSNEDIDDLLANMTNDAVSKDEIAQLRTKLLEEDRGSTISVSERDLYQQLRINLLAKEVMAMLRNSTESMQMEAMRLQMTGSLAPDLLAMPPAEAWDLYRRTARQVEVEVLPLEVEKFVDEVKTSFTTAQKNELFEKYKDVPPSPASPEPGFASPYKVSLGYVRVAFQPFLDKAKAEITDEAIRKEYDDRLEKGELKVPVLPDDKKPEEKDNEDPDKAKPDDTDPKPEGDKPEDKKPEDNESKEKPADENAEEKPDDKKPEEKPPEEQADEEELEENSDTDPAEVKPEDKPADEKDSEEKDPEKKPDEKKPADDEKDPADKPEDKEPDEKKTEDKTAKDKEEKKEPETRIKTYEEMEEEIRKQLAQKPAQDAEREAVDELFRVIDEFKAAYKQWEYDQKAASQDKKAQPAGPRPELAPLLAPVLKKYDFQYKQTPLVDMFEMEEEEVGKAQIVQQQPVSLAALYDERVQVYQAYPAQGLLRDVTYILWKETEQPQKTAVRSEVEEDIVKALKLQEAFKLAKAEAERLAEKAQDSKGLRESLGAVDKAGAVVDAGPFSWLSSGFMPGGMGMRLQMTEIPNVPYAGEEFMQTVNDLEPGQVGVAPDQPHKKVYVIYVKSQTPNEELLRTMFLARGLGDRNVSQLHSAERLGMINSWINNLLDKEMQLHWNRSPIPFER